MSPLLFLICIPILSLYQGTKWYYEFVFGGDGDKILAQIGFADSEFKAVADRGQGVGDDDHSWGCDLMRLRKWGTAGTPYAADLELKAKDIVGCTLDLDAKTISYSVNGKDLGVAFEGVSDSDGLSLFLVFFQYIFVFDSSSKCI